MDVFAPPKIDNRLSRAPRAAEGSWPGLRC